MANDAVPQAPHRPWFRSPWGLALAYTLFIVLFGAVVRITGSGAGCGQHWPTCQGESLHLPRAVEEWIEYGHRITAGLGLLAVIGLTVGTFLKRERGDVARFWAMTTLVAFIVESLLGAVLVKFGLVDKDDSIARAVVMAIHLVNTSVFTAGMLLCALATRSSARVRFRFERTEKTFFVAGVLLLVVVSAAGAVTALGDTLYPMEEGQAAIEVARAAGSPTAHFLERVRGFHPLFAVAVAIFLVSATARLGRTNGARSRVLILLFTQVLAGVVNVWLSAPPWMQVVHLALANLLWLAWIALGAESALQTEETAPPRAAEPRTGGLQTTTGEVE